MALHRWNRDFVWRPARATPKTLTVEQVRAFDATGYFVVEDAFDAEELRRVIEEPFLLRLQAEARGLCEPGYTGKHSHRSLRMTGSDLRAHEKDSG